MSAETSNYARIEDEIEKYGVCAVNTSGRSMLPLLKTNDAVNVKAIDRKIKKRDVVLYKNHELAKYVLHRVISIEDDVYVIRGDNTYRKEFVPKEDVIGYMISYIKKGKIKSTKCLSYRLYSRLWPLTYPLRILRIKIKAKKSR